MGEARAKMARYAETRLMIEQLETQAATELAEAVEAYAWPEDVPVPDEFDGYRVQNVHGVAYGEDLASELAVSHKTSSGGATYLVRDITILTRSLPGCWEKVTGGEAPLWQARMVAQACEYMDPDQCQIIDGMVAPALGAVGGRRLGNLITAAVKKANPEPVLNDTKRPARSVYVGGDKDDPGTGRIYAVLDRADTLFFDAHLHRIADKMAADGDTDSLDSRLAKAAAMMCNPGAVIQYIGLPTTRGMDPAPMTDTEKQEFINQVGKITPKLAPRTQVYLHIHADTVTDPHGLTRLEQDGPALIGEIHKITKGSNIRVTPVVHVGDYSEPVVDAYEIPDHIRELVLLRSPYGVSPWSSRESRYLDLDHTKAYEEGADGQTRPSNLAPVDRRGHRVKTHAGWNMEQPRPGTIIWTTGTGRRILVNYTGTHRLPALE